MAYTIKKTPKNSDDYYLAAWRAKDGDGNTIIKYERYNGPDGKDGAQKLAEYNQSLEYGVEYRISAPKPFVFPFLLNNNEIRNIWAEFSIVPIFEDGNDLPFYIETVYGLIDPNRFRLNRPPYLYIGATNSISNETVWDKYYGSGTHLKRIHPYGMETLQRIIIHPLKVDEAKRTSALKLESEYIKRTNANTDERFFNGGRWSDEEKYQAEKNHRPDSNKNNPKERVVDLAQVRLKEWWSLAEFAALIGLATPTVREKYLKTGLIRSSKDGTRWLIHRSQLAAFNKIVNSEVINE